MAMNAGGSVTTDTSFVYGSNAKTNSVWRTPKIAPP